MPSLGSPIAPGVYNRGGNTEVAQLQQKLKEAGFDPGPIDGVMGPKTRAAEAAFNASGGGSRIAQAARNVGMAPQAAPSGAGGGGGSYGATPQFAAQSSPSGPNLSEIDAIARQLALQEQGAQSQLAFGTQQGNYQNALSRNQLLNSAYRQTADAQTRQASLRPQLGEVDTNLERALSNIQRQGTFDKANLQDQMIGRGLGQSGIRLGSEGRQQADLVQRQGDTSLAAQQQKDAIQRQLSEIDRNWLAGQQELGANIQAIKDQAVPTAPSLDELIKKYRQGLGG